VREMTRAKDKMPEPDKKGNTNIGYPEVEDDEINKEWEVVMKIRIEDNYRSVGEQHGYSPDKNAPKETPHGSNHSLILH
jgi:hypothetical protein